jgi:hypothetical protein
MSKSLRVLLATTLMLLMSICPVLAAEYTPNDSERSEIQRLTDRYFALLDAQDYVGAYSMQTPGLQTMMPFADFEAMMKSSKEKLGPLVERQQTKTTWHLDPDNAPRPGLYVAVDFVSHYKNANQHSEYLIWYRGSKKEPFLLTRHETNFMLDKDATVLAQQEAQPQAQEQPPLEEAKGNVIGYPTVEAARKALVARDGVKVRPMQDGWLVIEDPSENAVWSFSPEGHPSYPAVVKRYTYQEAGKVMLGMTALCQAEKKPCDDLIRQFQEMNKKVIESADSRH